METKYSVKKNKHHFSPRKIKFFTKNILEISGYFDKSCLYTFNNIEDYDINKLAGFSTSLHHHIQSARVGWRPSKLINGNIELLTYVYDNSFSLQSIGDLLIGNSTKRLDERFLLSVSPNENFTIILTNSKEGFNFTAWSEKQPNEIIVDIPKKYSSLPIKYLLHPYFGGNNTAPENMVLFLRNL